ncbi:hypothetical protein E1100_25775 [Vibrio owensii]|uniref:HP1 family phage holin n=1 Tax=Vibrio owensii TaxID=696485 RepID=UPI0010532375|nr:HP1 family phage holin [Vibrio owensii]TDE19272.1 hypothetical protein E1100_25775 [Vibrio owensii]
MLERNKLWLTALASAFAAFFIARGEKLTQFFAGWATVLGAFSVSEWGVIGGLILGFASFILTWVYKHKNHEVLKTKVANGEPVKALLEEDD